jgi:hypothetical protein
VSMREGNLKYPSLVFVCPGCVAMGGGSGLHHLPVNTEVKAPSREFAGNLYLPTLSPSIKTQGAGGSICHSFLRGGVFEFLQDCTHALKGQFVEIPSLPDWFLEEHSE